MNADGDTVRRRWWREPRTLAVAVGTLLVLALLHGLFGPDPPIVVSPETTVITGPPAADGLPDYAAARLALAGPAPPTEDNAAVDLLRVAWPLNLAPPDLRAVCTALGIPDSPPAATVVIPMPTWDGTSGVTLEMIRAAESRPWTDADHPPLARWLATHEGLLDRLVSAADKSRYWIVHPSSPVGDPEIDSDAWIAARLTWPIMCRAQLHLGADRHAAAWRDLRAIHRWGRLVTDPRSGPRKKSSRWYAILTRNGARMATARCLLADQRLPNGLLADIRAEFAADSPETAPEDLIRADYLDTVSTIVALSRLSGQHVARVERIRARFGGVDALVAAAVASRIDWNAVLVAFNEAHDDLAAALRLPTHATRNAALRRLNAGWADTLPAWRTSSESSLEVLRGVLDPRHREATLAAWFAKETFSDALGFHDSDLEGATGALVRTAAALATWRADRPPGEPPFPNRLEDLVPRFLDRVPVDPFTDRPLIYRRVGDGMLLMSTGFDGVDNAGDDALDVVVRMPAPPGPAAPPPAP